MANNNLKYKILGGILFLAGLLLSVSSLKTLKNYFIDGIIPSIARGIPCSDLHNITQALIIETTFVFLGLFLAVNSIKFLALKMNQRFAFPKFQIIFILLIIFISSCFYHYYGKLPPSYGDCQGSARIDY